MTLPSPAVYPGGGLYPGPYATPLVAWPDSYAPSAGPIPNSYVVRQGDSLTSIAARLYGNPMMFVELANVNGLRDPRLIRAGQVIRLLP